MSASTTSPRSGLGRRLLGLGRRFASMVVRGFHVYGAWLVGITWGRFIIYALLLLIMSGVLQNLPPFSWTYTETIVDTARRNRVTAPPEPPAPTAPVETPKKPAIVIDGKNGRDSVDISIDENGIRIRSRKPSENASATADASVARAAAAEAAAAARAEALGRDAEVQAELERARAEVARAKREAEAARRQVEAERARLAAREQAREAGLSGEEIERAADAAAQAAQQAAAAAATAAASAAEVAASGGSANVVRDGRGTAVEIQAGDRTVRIALPEGADTEAVRDALDEARRAVVEAISEQSDAIQEAAAEAAEAAADTEIFGTGPRVRTRTVSYGESLPQAALMWILMSILLKFTYKGRMQAEVKAAQATETAEAESLKRQVVEARMAAMQAQVEPHFLFNTLASIDHLIETDPPRASQMQRNLIALLRASMPTMRETGENAIRDLGRELLVVRPYIEILKVRMEERLDAKIDVPDGLLSAEFPPMMIQTLVENAIRHGLEPKAEGGQLRLKAEIVHGKLAVTVSDTGVGFGAAATAGTGVGLSNIRERLQLLHGRNATLTVSPNTPSGTVVTITVPYRPVGAEAHAAA